VLTLKDIVTVILSVIGVALTATAAYFTLIRQTENIGLVVQSIPVGRKFEPTGISFVSRDGMLVFNNSGTRQATILGGELFFAKPGEYGLTCVRGVLWAPIYELAFEPITLKPGEASARPTKIKKALGDNKLVADGETLLKFPFTLGEKQTAELCVHIELSTPSISRHYASVLVMEVGAGPGPTVFWGGGGSAATPESPPQTLLRKTGTVFD
jgi:hypothetical protein